MPYPEQSMEVAVPTETALETRWVALVILVTFGGFLLWGLLAQLDAGAIAMGEIVPAGRVRTVQHLEGGIIQAIKVRDGDRVKPGDELIVLDDTEIRAALKIAERDIEGLRARLVDVNGEIAGWSARNRSLSKLAANAEEESKINRQLYEQNFISKPRLLQLESQKAQADVTLGENAAELSRALQKKAELEASEASARERRTVALQRLERSRIVAPEGGVVNNLKYATIGGVIQPGGPILDIVPDSEELLVEARVSPDDIDVVHPGLECRVKLTAYKARSHITLKGKVITVSGTTVRDEASQGRSFYKVRIEIAARELEKIDRGMLTSGMLAQVEIISGSRSPIRYMFDPIIESFGRAFKES